MCCPCYSRMVVLEWPNCLNGKSFLRGRGRGMTNFQLCGSGNWAADDPLIKTKKRRFRVSLGHDCLTHIWGGSNLITIEVSNLQGPVLTPQCIMYCSSVSDSWHLTSWHVTCLTPFVPRHWSTSIPWARVEKQTFIPSRPFIPYWSAISKEFRANGTLCKEAQYKPCP